MCTLMVHTAPHVHESEATKYQNIPTCNYVYAMRVYADNEHNSASMHYLTGSVTKTRGQMIGTLAWYLKVLVSFLSLESS
jgi:hypothetical protein